MKEQLEAYIDSLFAGAALTVRNAELRQEILQHTLDRYDDLIAEGKSEQAAFDEAVAGIGDVSELYERKKTAKTPDEPEKKRDFPAPGMTPAQTAEAEKKRDFPAPGMYPPQRTEPVKKKRFPGWAIALICVGVALLLTAVVMALSFAGSVVHTAVSALPGGEYSYGSEASYDMLPRGSVGADGELASKAFEDITSIEVHWLSGDVYVHGSLDGQTWIQEDYSGDNDDYRLRYSVEGTKLIVQPCRSGAWDLPRKALTVSVPDIGKLKVETVSAGIEILDVTVKDASFSTVSGDILGSGLVAQELDLETVSGSIRPSKLAANDAACDTVSGDVSLAFRIAPQTLELGSTSGDMKIVLPKTSYYVMEHFETVSGDLDTENYTPGTADRVDITAETVSGNLRISSN